MAVLLLTKSAKHLTCLGNNHLSESKQYAGLMLIAIVPNTQVPHEVSWEETSSM